MLSNADKTQSLHGTPFGGTDRSAFIDKWHVKPSGFTKDGILYSKNSLQFGATLKILYQQKFLKDLNGKERIAATYRASGGTWPLALQGGNYDPRPLFRKGSTATFPGGR
jgi:hypothetical protein